MDRDAFEQVVQEALEEIREEFAPYLENVAVVIEDEPSPALLHSLDLKPGRDSLFGLYQGVPLDERPHAFGNALPDTITIFYWPLVRACRTPGRIRREVRRTVIHEIGHHFGFDESALEREGY